MIARIDEKVSWTGFSILTGLVAWGIFSMKPSKVRKVLIQNGCFSGFLLVTVIALAKLRKLQQRREAMRKAEQVGIMQADKEE
jgi:hypothetical protein